MRTAKKVAKTAVSFTNSSITALAAGVIVGVGLRLFMNACNYWSNSLDNIWGKQKGDN